MHWIDRTECELYDTSSVETVDDIHACDDLEFEFFPNRDLNRKSMKIIDYNVSPQT